MFRTRISLFQSSFAKRFLFLTLSAVLIVFGSVTFPPSRKVKGQSKPNACPTCSQAAQRMIYVPTIGVPEADASEIVLNCRSPHAMIVTPTFYTTDGEAIVGDLIQMQPHEMRFVSTESLVPEAERGRHIWGGMSLSYNGMLREMWAQLTFRSGSTGGSADMTFAVLDNTGSNTQAAVWWQPSPGIAVIALGNSSSVQIHTTVEFARGETQDVDIAPFATSYIRHINTGKLNSIVKSNSVTKFNAYSATIAGSGEAVRLTTSGPAGSLKALGFIVSADKQFATGIRFYDILNAVQPDLFATNFRLKNCVSHLILRNTSSNSITASPHFRPLTNGGGATVDLPAVTLAAGEVKELNLQPLKAAASNRTDLDAVSVQVGNSGAAGSLIGALYSTNQTSNVIYEVPLRDSGPMSSSTGAYPVRLDNDYSTIVSITNVSNDTARFSIVIRYDGGQYILHVIDLGAGQSAVFDIRKIRDQHIADQNGQVLPDNFTTGQFGWGLIKESPDNNGRLIGRAEVVSKSRRDSRSYSCPTCCNSMGPNADDPATALTPFAGGYFAGTENGSWYDCYGNLMSYHAITLMNFASQDTSIATMSNSSGTTLRADGVAPGQTTWSARYYQTLYTYNSPEREAAGENSDDATQRPESDPCGGFILVFVGGDIEVRPQVTDVTAQGATKITKVVGNQGIIHFVTPKGNSTDIVTLTATISPDTQAFRNNISWNGATQSANNPLQATVSKSNSSKNVILINYNGHTIKELRVWVVWATITSPSDFPIDSSSNGQFGNPPGTGLVIRGGYRFNHTIEPARIITDSDRPDFSGANINSPPGGNHPIFGTPLSGGANKKWDVSRQIRLKVLNPANISNNDFTTPAFPNIPNYPTNEVEGNDNAQVINENNDPYSNNGVLTDADLPTYGIVDRAASDGDTYEARMQFREFTRLEIEGTWTRISDYFLWRIHFKFLKANGLWTNNGTDKALDNNGF